MQRPSSRRRAISHAKEHRAIVGRSFRSPEWICPVWATESAEVGKIGLAERARSPGPRGNSGQDRETDCKTRRRLLLTAVTRDWSK